MCLKHVCAEQGFSLGERTPQTPAHGAEARVEKPSLHLATRPQERDPWMEKTFACHHGMMTCRLSAETCVRTVRLDRLLWIRALTRRAAQAASLALESVLSPAAHVLRIWVMCRSAVTCTTSVEATASGFLLVFPSQSGPRVHSGDPRGIRIVVPFGDVSNVTFSLSGTCSKAYEMSSSG